MACCCIGITDNRLAVVTVLALWLLRGVDVGILICELALCISIVSGTGYIIPRSLGVLGITCPIAVHLLYNLKLLVGCLHVPILQHELILEHIYLKMFLIIQVRSCPLSTRQVD